MAGHFSLWDCRWGMLPGFPGRGAATHQRRAWKRDYRFAAVVSRSNGRTIVWRVAYHARGVWPRGWGGRPVLVGGSTRGRHIATRWRGLACSIRRGRCKQFYLGLWGVVDAACSAVHGGWNRDGQMGVEVCGSGDGDRLAYDPGLHPSHRYFSSTGDGCTPSAPCSAGRIGCLQPVLRHCARQCRVLRGLLLQRLQGQPD
mmetsp:Transcript_14975/g.26529  ORF Transcript_14975/g.26529 Transcript_14975/m.26529 type:complete len:200 (+) Transcript_14975:186-785(+)